METSASVSVLPWQAKGLLYQVPENPELESFWPVVPRQALT